ncbi:MAG: aminotransferase class I/II-fold pyridoxal phosphate-dependent enzyme, partial [Planctomycetota bacterium]
MRTTLVPPGVKHLEYEIRNIVDDANRLQQLGVDMIWENIGDPIAAGEEVAPWIQEIVQALVKEHGSWAYCPSRGVTETREFLAARVNARGGVQVTADDILFVNGIADAVDKIYDLIRKDARVIMPTPCYPTHSSNEAKRGEYPYLFFHLDPTQGWRP